MITPAAETALEPLRQAILRAAHDDARQRLGLARERAAAALDQARAEAGRMLRDARTAGAAEAGAQAVGELARRRLEARTIVLAARRERYDEVGRLAMRRLRRAGLDPALRARIAATLGPGAHVAPAPGGGLIDTAGDRTVDCSLTALVRHAMPAVGGSIEEAWL